MLRHKSCASFPLLARLLLAFLKHMWQICQRGAQKKEARRREAAERKEHFALDFSFSRLPASSPPSTPPPSKAVGEHHIQHFLALVRLIRAKSFETLHPPERCNDSIDNGASRELPGKRKPKFHHFAVLDFILSIASRHPTHCLPARLLKNANDTKFSLIMSHTRVREEKIPEAFGRRRIESWDAGEGEKQPDFQRKSIIVNKSFRSYLETVLL
jgi:hypothetical protein